MADLHPQIIPMIALVRAEELAAAWGYSGVNAAFRGFCAKLGIQHVPGRPGWYDPCLVRHRLNAVQGMLPLSTANGQQISLVEQRRARIGPV